MECQEKIMMLRCIDLVFAAGGLLLSAPLCGLISLLIWLESGRPVLYTPMMVGERGRPFRLQRFRTLRAGPDGLHLTHVGRLIRGLSLDHLPMLVNLLRGDLTLVGPRPMEPQFVDMQDPSWQEYFQARPGILNPAVLQLGRRWTPSRAQQPDLHRSLELSYLRHRSVRSDLMIFARSLGAWVASRGNIKERKEPDPDVDKASDA